MEVNYPHENTVNSLTPVKLKEGKCAHTTTTINNIQKTKENKTQKNKNSHLWVINI